MPYRPGRPSVLLEIGATTGYSFSETTRNSNMYECSEVGWFDSNLRHIFFRSFCVSLNIAYSVPFRPILHAPVASTNLPKKATVNLAVRRGKSLKDV